MIDTNDVKQRKARLQKLMKQNDCELLVVYSNALKPDNVFYVTGYNLLAGEAWATMDINGHTCLWISEDWEHERAAKESWANQLDNIENVRKSVGTWSGSTTLLVGKELVPLRYAEFMETFLSNVENGNSLLVEAALIRTPGELEYLREAARIADAGFIRACEVARPGITEIELLAEIEYSMRKIGATDNFQLMASGTHNKGMVVGRNKLLENGELLLFEITPAYKSVTYSAQLCRSIYLGEPQELIVKKYSILVEAMQDALDAIRPGMQWNEVYSMQNEIISAAGYGEYCKPPYMRTRGHGFGLTQPFNIDDANTSIIEPGMVLVLHPNQYIPETGYLALGEMIVVTDDGCERMSKTKMELVNIS